MIKQPERESRNVNDSFYESEAKRISLLNEIFAEVELSNEEMKTLIWLASCEDSTVKNLISAMRKVMEVEPKKL